MQTFARPMLTGEMCLLSGFETETIRIRGDLACFTRRRCAHSVALLLRHCVFDRPVNGAAYFS